METTLYGVYTLVVLYSQNQQNDRDSAPLRQVSLFYI